MVFRIPIGVLGIILTSTMQIKAKGKPISMLSPAKFRTSRDETLFLTFLSIVQRINDIRIIKKKFDKNFTKIV